MFKHRAATAAVLIPLVVAVVWRGPLWLLDTLVAVVATLALTEFFHLARTAGLEGWPVWAALCSVWLVAARGYEAAHMPEALRAGWTLQPVSPLWAEQDLVLLCFLLGLGAATVTSDAPAERRLARPLTTAAGLLLIGWPMSTAVAIVGYAHGRALLLVLLVLVWAGDTAAYLIGRGLGRHALAPSLSPGKTWEGALANLLASAAVGLVAARWLPLRAPDLVLLCILANLAGQTGDLLESAYKRAARAKDSGQLLPGHGGMLDRVDSLIFAAPVFWQVLEWLHRAGRA